MDTRCGSVVFWWFTLPEDTEVAMPEKDPQYYSGDKQPTNYALMRSRSKLPFLLLGAGALVALVMGLWFWETMVG